MIVVVHGPDALLTRASVREVVRAHDPADTNTSELDGRTTSLGQITSAVGSAGFFGTGRVVVVHDLLSQGRGGRSAPGDETASNSPGSVDIERLFAAVPPENLLVLSDPALTAPPAAVKKLVATNPRMARIVSNEPFRGRELIGWVVRTATESGGAFEPAAAKLLVETLYPQTWQAKPSNPRYDRPPDLALIRSRVETLVLYAHPEDVAVRHVRALVSDAPNDRIFRFVEAASSGNLGTAAAELDELLLAGEEPAKLLAQVLGQIELVMVADAGSHLDPAAIGRQLGLSNPLQMSAIARGLGAARTSAAAAVVAGADTERAFKTGKIRQPGDALMTLLARLSDTGEPGS